MLLLGGVFICLVCYFSWPFALYSVWQWICKACVRVGPTWWHHSPHNAAQRLHSFSLCAWKRDGDRRHTRQSSLHNQQEWPVKSRYPVSQPEKHLLLDLSSTSGEPLREGKFLLFPTPRQRTSQSLLGGELSIGEAPWILPKYSGDVSSSSFG